MLFTEPFLSSYRRLSARARKLRDELTEKAYAQHPDVKLFIAVRRVASELVPADPHRADYLLTGPLAKFRRTKGHGLPARYRLFWVFSDQLKVIIFLYMNDNRSLRKEGARDDPYRLFQAMVNRGEIGRDFEDNYERWRARSKGALARK